MKIRIALKCLSRWGLLNSRRTENFNQAIATPYLCLRNGFEAQGRAGDALIDGRFTHQNRVSLMIPRQLLKPARNIHCVSDCGKLTAVRCTNIPDNSLSNVDTDSYAYGVFTVEFSALIQFLEPTSHREGTSNGPLGMIELGDRRVEIGEKTVAKIFVESATVTENDINHTTMELIEKFDDVTCIH